MEKGVVLVQAMALAARRPERDTARAMSQENVDVVRGILAGFQGLDWVAFLRDTDPGQVQVILEAVYDPDVEIIWVDTSPDAGPHRGHQGVLQAFNGWLDSFEEFHFDPTEFIDAGDDVVVPNNQVGVGKGSGAEVEMTTAWVCTVKGGKIARVREYSNKDKALEASGLRK
jgi:ketosteroid isomerase-like protein